MQPVKVAFPQDFETIYVIVIGKVGDEQIQMTCQFTLLDAHLPIDVLSLILVFIPLETDMVIFHIFYQRCPPDILLSPGLSPRSGEMACRSCDRGRRHLRLYVGRALD